MLALTVVVLLAADPAAARTAAWKADLQVIATELPKKHKNAFFKTSREAFARQVAVSRTIPVPYRRAMAA